MENTSLDFISAYKCGNTKMFKIPDTSPKVSGNRHLNLYFVFN